jgi:uncharacterized protein (DUF2147 family)
MPRRLLLITAILFAALPPPAFAASPIGTWLTQQNDARIRIARCGPAICGTIVWLHEPINPATGKPQVDDKNPDPKKVNRRIVGMQIFAMRPNGSNGWSGSIYNSKDGNTYDAAIEVPSATELKVRGCAGPLCGSETWSRVQ